jgi:glyoxylase-like metal-dependent hydrolase (beta-lactamase superfamily II)
MSTTQHLVFAATTALLTLGQTDRGATTFERGTMRPRWTVERQDCAHEEPFLVHEYNPSFVIIRQSGCTNFEKPFLYLLFGSREALLVDTGATGAHPADVVGRVISAHAGSGKPLPLLVVHSHGHGDHVAGDAEFSRREDTRLVEGKAEAVAKFFGIRNWPDGAAQYDLGGRIVDIIAIPGHQPASIAVYDRRTGILLTGDTLYPGRLYVRDAAAFRSSIDRLVVFTATREVTHVLGAHIEQARTPFADYPEGTTFQPDEHMLELGRAHLLELQDALDAMGGRIERRARRDFTVWPVQ